jgi:hypothetical protein
VKIARRRPILQCSECVAGDEIQRIGFEPLRRWQCRRRGDGRRIELGQQLPSLFENRGIAADQHTIPRRVGHRLDSRRAREELGQMPLGGCRIDVIERIRPEPSAVGVRVALVRRGLNRGLHRQSPTRRLCTRRRRCRQRGEQHERSNTPCPVDPVT